MQKWQYLYLFRYSDSKYYLNGVEYKHQPKETIFMVLDRLGSEGWEAVHIVADPSGYVKAFQFKRPLA